MSALSPFLIICITITEINRQYSVDTESKYFSYRFMLLTTATRFRWKKEITAPSLYDLLLQLAGGEAAVRGPLVL